MDTETGEHVIFKGHPSWRSIVGFYIVGILAVALAAAIAAGIPAVGDDGVSGGVVAAVAAVGTGLLVLVGLLKRIATTYTITNRRLHIRRGIVARNVEQARLERIQNVSTSQSVLERILQVGTVDFDTAATGDADFAFKGVAQPEKVMASVNEAQREYEREYGREIPDAAETAPPGGPAEPDKPAEERP
jgi:uncharacterized membrane protein YdbT with pleckstrin-like domain